MRLVRFLYCLCALLSIGAAQLQAAPQAAGKDLSGFHTRAAHQIHDASEAHFNGAFQDPESLNQFIFDNESEDDDDPKLTAQAPLAATLIGHSPLPHPGYSAILCHPCNRFGLAAGLTPAPVATYLLLGVLRI